MRRSSPFGRGVYIAIATSKKESGEGERGVRDMHGLKWCVSTAALLTTLALLHQVMRKTRHYVANVHGEKVAS